MPSGGKRKGAGRKSKLTPYQKAWVADIYNSIRIRSVDAATMSRVTKEYDGSEYEQLVNAIHSLPTSPLFRGENPRVVMHRIAESGDFIECSHLNDCLCQKINSAAEDFNAIRELRSSRKTYFAAKPIRSFKSEALQQTAIEATRFLKVEVSISQVTKAIRDFPSGWDF